MTTTIEIDHRNADHGGDPDEGPLYFARRKIQPIAVHGRFRRIKTVLLLVTLGIYYLLPFVRWDRGADAPGQAVLIDFPARRFYFFFVEIWPQEFYYVTGLLILAALALFLMNAVAGRIWCGYLCPQTVWTDLFLGVERMVEGDRRARLLLDAAPWSAEKLAKRTAKHGIWLLIAWWTGGAWVLYFADAPTLVAELATGTAPLVAYGWIAVLTGTTYFLAGHMREQVCTYMCPWPRIQAALTDEHALNVTYRYDRGEPRMSFKKATAARAAAQPAGDCVDCGQCVAACPTGVDIRAGLQLDCIQCGLCIDACDAVMEKVGRPTALIAYDTELNVRARIEGRPEVRRIVRPRTVLYAALIVAVGAVMLTALATRTTTDVAVIHDRNPVFVRLSDGGVRNGYTLRLVNKTTAAAQLRIVVGGLPGVGVEVIGAETLDGVPVVTVGRDQTREMRMVLSLHAEAAATVALDQVVPITVAVENLTTGEQATAGDNFRTR
ncbi:cytochrome c oxidase accessory protein CcoG [Methylobrevis albus]|uniref:Cytochrome c oxidase accessory protein CcoG n=1 Tax=Methylobrevis albus TaxID=2793297 RepID=A0A931MXA5_9HYPH|nr:cytochrome c oxidase accessory protein CcoG [Methylobrevis albus]MBH0238718.1 cytochrome c oxidase accessory protein CcoG [Methylobrevis albus]